MMPRSRKTLEKREEEDISSKLHTQNEFSRHVQVFGTTRQGHRSPPNTANGFLAAICITNGIPSRTTPTTIKQQGLYALQMIRTAASPATS